MFCLEAPRAKLGKSRQNTLHNTRKDSSSATVANGLQVLYTVRFGRGCFQTSFRNDMLQLVGGACVDLAFSRSKTNAVLFDHVYAYQARAMCSAWGFEKTKTSSRLQTACRRSTKDSTTSIVRRNVPGTFLLLEIVLVTRQCPCPNTKTILSRTVSSSFISQKPPFPPGAGKTIAFAEKLLLSFLAVIDTTLELFLGSTSDSRQNMRVTHLSLGHVLSKLLIRFWEV